MSSYTSFPVPTLAGDNSGLKPIHYLIVDTGPLIKNDPAVSTLLSKSESICTIPAVLSEIKDPDTRSRVETTLVPFLKLRNPRAESIKFVTDFARKTGDLEVLSKPDIHLVALTYEIQYERDGGDSRLQTNPRDEASTEKKERPSEIQDSENDRTQGSLQVDAQAPRDQTPRPVSQDRGTASDVEAKLADLTLSSVQSPISPTRILENIPEAAGEEENLAGHEQKECEEPETEDSDADGWITPTNVHKHIEADKKRVAPEADIVGTLEAALLTSDYAMQNVALRIGLTVLSPNMSRITKLKTWVLRCHGCFAITRIMSKQFCPRCGHDTLLRTSCSTDENGNFQIYLKKNFQWNNRGTIYSIPKPVHGTTNGKNRGQGGGKHGWGQGLIFAEDQKEYVRAQDSKRRERKKDLMDDDYLPSILSGDRSGSKHGKVKIGVGRGVNGTKRRR